MGALPRRPPSGGAPDSPAATFPRIRTSYPYTLPRHAVASRARRTVMVPTLIESARRTDKQRVLGTAVVSFTIHAGVIAGAVFATQQVKRTDHTVRVDTTMVLLALQQRPKVPEQQPAQLDVPLKGFQVVVVPPEIPADIPP